MAAYFRVFLWACVLVAPGGILLAPFLIGSTLRSQRTSSS